ncbi:hypothetical protein VNI00_012478 [Paramarasmius palmivorus]|uniref:CSC1/OSCA1-like 7TM region domain-containing protein n=1 Tax=Paramarasmius palmivorus TaxID=297713 RepID=A0AAW0C731_9AGAR
MKDVDKLYEQAVAVNAAYSLGSVVMNSILTLLTGTSISEPYLPVFIPWQPVAFGGSIDNFESGILYPLFQIVGLIQINVTDAMIFPFDFFPIATLSAVIIHVRFFRQLLNEIHKQGIAPTLIMVRAKLGKNVENLETGEVVSDIHFNDRARPTTTTTGSQVQSHGVSLAENTVGVQGEEGKRV